MNRRWFRFAKDESGQVLVLFALLLTVIFGFTALAVDVGGMVVTKSQVQNAADAAALAGAQDLLTENNPAETATAYAASNEIMDTQVSYPKENQIKVLCSKEYNYKFGRVLPIDNPVQISASAIAQKGKKWNGEALPFINMDDLFENKGDKIQAWEPVGPGNKERIHDDVLEYSESMDRIKIKIQEGPNGDYVKMKGGYAEGSELPDVLYNIVVKDNTVYLLSLKNSIIEAGVLDGEKIADIKINKYPMLVDNLVLLKCTVDEDWYKPGNTVYLTFQEAYDFDDEINGFFITSSIKLVK